MYPRPPLAMQEAYKAQDDAALGQMLDVLFCIHGYVDGAMEEGRPWDSYMDDFTWSVMKMYERGGLSTRLTSIAPDWPSAKKLAFDWYQQWPHSCGDADWWVFRHDELDEPKAILFFEGMTEQDKGQ